MTSQSIRNINDNMALSVTSICMQGYTPSHLSSQIIGDYFVSMLLITCISLNEYRDKGGDIFTVKYIIYSIFNAKCSQFTNIYSKYQIWFFSGGGWVQNFILCTCTFISFIVLLNANYFDKFPFIWRFSHTHADETQKNTAKKCIL